METTAQNEAKSGDNHLRIVPREVEELDAVTVRFCGDSGDGMQLTGSEFTKSSALAGNDPPTFRPRSGRRPAHCPASPASRSSSRATRSTPRATRRTCSSR